MGLMLGEGDDRFSCHTKFYEQCERSADVVLIENVSEYPAEDMVNRYLNKGKNDGPWKCKSFKVDPRLWGFAAARPRVYALTWNAQRVAWDDRFDFTEILNTLKARPCMEAKDYFWEGLPKSTLSGADETSHKYVVVTSCCH